MPIRCVWPAAVLLVLLALGQAAAAPPDALAVARQAYNAGQYLAAVAAAREAMEDDGTRIEAAVVLGRALVERYRVTAEQQDLVDARTALVAATGGPLAPALRSEWLVGSAQVLFFEEQFGAASGMFALLLEDPRAEQLVPGGRERLLDWWATACDRAAQGRDATARRGDYEKLAQRLQRELTREPSMGAAAYWLVVAVRGSGDLDLAWDAALAAWVRAPLASDRGAQLHADLDRVVSQALIPELARRAGKDSDQAAEALRQRWQEFKGRWTIRQ